MKQELEQAITACVQAVYGAQVADAGVELSRPDEQFGDFSTNVALQLASTLGRRPREIADELAARLRIDLDERLSEVTVAGPGFINLRLTDAELLAHVIQPRQVQARVGSAVIETNNPNPFKAMHIGHAFNAILADTIANLLDFGHADVHRVSYHGDVGAHVGKSMWSLLRFVDGDPAKLDTVPADERNTFMSKMYAEGARAYAENEAAKQEIDQLAQQSFTLDEPVYAAVYQTCKDWSFQQIDALVAQLGNKPTERRYLESSADAIGVETVRAHVPEVFQESDGALVFEGSKYGAFDNAFVSSTGRGLYAARDLGLMQLKHRDYPSASKSFIVTAEEQRDYFKGVIKAAELCLPQLAGMTVNISTGTLKLSTGKMSSRSGDVVTVRWLFDEVAAALQKRGGDPNPELVAGALRYQFLKVRIGSDVVFDISESVSMQGNTGSYLQYAHARARSILAKAVSAPDTAPASYQPDERSLLRKLGEAADATDRAVAELMPHHICAYLYELAQSFNRFYEHNRVIGDEREAVRLQLVQLYADTLRTGLDLLGIAAPDRM